MKKLFASIVTFLVISTTATSAFGSGAIQDFPSCLNPQGIQKASYNSGTHGIVGDYSDHTGADTVYQLDGNNRLLQCFCGDNGLGIQTNWLKSETLSSSNKDTLISLGYTNIPNGFDWGLDEGVYMAKNVSYVCNAYGTGGGDWTGMAGTGNVTTIYAYGMIGLLAIATGVIIKRKSA
jgi:hypothetical protein